MGLSINAHSETSAWALGNACSPVAERLCSTQVEVFALVTRKPPFEGLVRAAFIKKSLTHPKAAADNSRKQPVLYIVA